MSRSNQLKNSAAIGELQALNGKSGSSKMNNLGSDINIVERNKVKRQSRTHEPDQKLTEANKPAKKHKRDI